MVSFVRMERLERQFKTGGHAGVYGLLLLFFGYEVTGEQDHYAH